jgi:hypothetical protein
MRVPRRRRTCHASPRDSRRSLWRRAAPRKGHARRVIADDAPIGWSAPPWRFGGVLLVLGLAVRIWDVQRGPPLGPWHTVVPEEMTARRWTAPTGRLAHRRGSGHRDRAARGDGGAGTQEQLAAEPLLFRQPDVIRPASRRTGTAPSSWPEGTPRGAAVFLHGLTDAPFSLRHIAEAYRARGFVAVAIRMPGHGTVPAGLTRAVWEDWMAATRLAVREARARAGEGRPLHLVGYSNGGALAMKHTRSMRSRTRASRGGAHRAALAHDRRDGLRALRRHRRRCPRCCRASPRPPGSTSSRSSTRSSTIPSR